LAEARQLRDVFSEALKIKTEQGRRQYLDDVCGGDTNFRQLVDELLEAHDEAGSFLTEFDPENTVGTAEIPEGVGTTIGAYELLEHIGEGGMGVVFRAAQSTPVRREVAIKVIKPGMDTREVIARFEAERQALAMMTIPTSPGCLMPAPLTAEDHIL